MSLERFFHYSGRSHAKVRRPPLNRNCVKLEHISIYGGCSSAAYEASQQHGGRVGVMVAANSGRPCGACGMRGRLRTIHPNHGTQEEDMVSNWMLTEAGSSRHKQDELFRSTINERWGMKNVDGDDPFTIQEIDYTAANTPEAYADTWLVRQARLSVKEPLFYRNWHKYNDEQYSRYIFDYSRSFECTLFFCAGPNAKGRNKRSSGSMARTFNKKAARNYRFFWNCVKVALRTALDAMISEGIEVAVLAKISCGLYSGEHFRKINRDFPTLVELVLKEPFRGLTRGHYFHRVILPELKEIPYD